MCCVSERDCEYTRKYQQGKILSEAKIKKSSGT